jgi:hypothetical protein
MADTTSTEDPFEDFDVDSGSEKEFLIANLRNDAPKDEVEQFREARKPLSLNFSSTVQQSDTTMGQKDFEETVRTAWVSDTHFGGREWQEFKFLQNTTPAEIDARIYGLILSGQDENGETPLPSLEYPAPHLVLQKKVEEFVRSHMFMVNKHVKPTTLQRREFTRDIYDYARAIGMGRHQADVEVIRARAAYRRDRGLARGLRLDESDDESTLGLEINDAAEYIAFMRNGMQRGPVDPAGAWKEITRLEAKSISLGSLSRKRKLDMVDINTANEAVLDIEKIHGDVTAKPLNKRERRRLKRLQSSGRNQKPIKLVETPPISEPRKKRKKARVRKRLALTKLVGSINVKPEDQLPTNTISKPTSTTQPDTMYIGKAGGETRHDKPLSPEDGKSAVLKLTKESKVESFITNYQGVHNYAGGDSWDLRQRNKKKRKRKTVDSSTNKAVSLDAKTEAEPDDSNIRIHSVQPSKGQPDTENFREDSRAIAELEKEGIKKNTVDDNGTAKPLSKLMSANSNKKMKGRRDRGTKRKPVTATHKASTFAAGEAVKDHHS